MNCTNQSSAYEEWKCQTLKGGIWSWYFPFPAEPAAFPEQHVQPHTPLCRHIAVCPRERRGQSRGALGRAPCQPSPRRTPDLGTPTNRGFAEESWRSRGRGTSRNWPRELGKDGTQRPPSRSRSPSKPPCLPPEQSALDPEPLLLGSSPDDEVPQPAVGVTGRQAGRPRCRRTRSERAQELRRCCQHGRQQCGAGEGKPGVVPRSLLLLQLYG